MDHRQLYRIKRGSITRRDGPEMVRMDANGRPLGKFRSFVTYMARSSVNPGALDEVELTDEEAQAFGMQKLERLARREIRTEGPVDLEPNRPETPPPTDKSADDIQAIIAELIETGEPLRDPGKLQKWRKDVETSGVLETVPRRKADVLDALRAASA